MGSGRGLWFNKNVGTAYYTGKFRLQFGKLQLSNWFKISLVYKCISNLFTEQIKKFPINPRKTANRLLHQC